jgi:hypothetical protein
LAEALARTRADLAAVLARQTEAAATALEPTTSDEEAATARKASEEAGWQGQRLQVRAERLEISLEAARARVEREKAEARRQLAIAARDAMLSRVQAEYFPLAGQLAGLLKAVHEAQPACRAVGIPAGPEELKQLLDLVRLPDLTAPLHAPLMWLPSTPLPDPISTLPPAFLAESRRRGDEGRRIAAQAAASRRG